jgi:YbgC/YbaW family acyl-CoA thioester hydrolase
MPATTTSSGTDRAPGEVSGAAGRCRLGDDAMVHEKTVLVSETHLDFYGHLNNARYHELFEQARWDLITSRGFGVDTIRRTNTGPVMLEVNIKFMRELAPREPIVIRSSLLSYEGKVGKIQQQMLKADGTVACEAVYSFGLFDLARRKLVEPTPAWAYAVGLTESPPAP